jgi:hypothetical protein
MEHCLDAGEDANRDRYGVLITGRVWDLPGNGCVGSNVFGKGTLVLVNT